MPSRVFSPELPAARPEKRANSGMSLKYALFVVAEKLLRWSISPRLRARLLSLLGATIGKNVRIYEIQLFNLKHGFSNLHIENDVHIGIGCRLDLEGMLVIAARSTLSPGVTILTHQDPGSSHGSRLLALYPAQVKSTKIGSDCWIGTNTVVLPGATIGSKVVVAAGSVVTSELPDSVLVAGVPASIRRSLQLP